MQLFSRCSCLVVAVVLACGGEAPPAPKTEPKAAPKVEPAKPAEAEVLLHERGRVFLVGGEVGFVPLACHLKADKPGFAGGEACVALLPVGAPVRGVDGVARKVTGTGKDPCE